jgi:hypothetical protein
MWLSIGCSWKKTWKNTPTWKNEVKLPFNERLVKLPFFLCGWILFSQLDYDFLTSRFYSLSKNKSMSTLKSWDSLCIEYNVCLLGSTVWSGWVTMGQLIRSLSAWAPVRTSCLTPPISQVSLIIWLFTQRKPLFCYLFRQCSETLAPTL